MRKVFSWGVALLILEAFLATFFLMRAVGAAPPVPGSEDYDRLTPYAGWITQQTTPYGGGGCCSVSDCRMVPIRQQANRYEAFIANTDAKGFTKFPGAPNTWVVVPDEVIKRNDNPTGEAVACWSSYKKDHDGFYCFFLPEMG